MMVFNMIARAALQLPGACICAVVDLESGSCLGQCGTDTGIGIERTCHVNAQVLRMKVRLVREQGLNESIQDIMITLNDHYHLIRLLDTKDGTPMLFFYLVLDRATANLVIARRKLADMEQALWRIPDIAKLIQDSSLAAMLQLPVTAESPSFQMSGSESDEGKDEIPSFMRDEVVRKLLGLPCLPLAVANGETMPKGLEEA